MINTRALRCQEARVATGWGESTKTLGMGSGDTLLVPNACSSPLRYPDLGAAA